MKRTRFTSKERLLVVAPLLILLWPVAVAVERGSGRDALTDALQRLAGPNAIDCGVSRFGSNGPVALRAAACFHRHRPFSARFSFGKADATGMAMTPQGQTYALMYKRGYWFSRGKISTMTLVERIKTDKTGIREILGVTVTPVERARLLTAK
jgi:hypothetical protein